MPIYFAPDAIESIVFGGRYGMPPAALPMPDNELEKYRGTYRVSSGGNFVVSIAHGGLSFQAQGRDAVGLLMYPDAEHSPSAVAERVRAAFDSIDHADFSALQSRVGPEAAADHTKRFGGFWRDWIAKLGRYEGTMFLYTATTGTRRSSYVELKFAKGTQVIRAAEDQFSVDRAHLRHRLSLSYQLPGTNSPILISGPAKTSPSAFHQGIIGGHPRWSYACQIQRCEYRWFENEPTQTRPPDNC